MAHAVKFDGANGNLTSPDGLDHVVSTLPVFRNGVTCISCWQLSPEEMREINASGGKVYLSVMFGNTQPPVFLGSESAVRDLNADYGVWQK